MKRLVLQLIVAFCLLLTGATAAVWVTSFWITYTVEFDRSGIVGSRGWVDTSGWVVMRPRMMVIAWWQNPFLHGMQPRERFDLRLEREPTTPDLLAPRDTIWGKLGFKHSVQATSHVIWIPSWLIIGCCAVTTALAARPLRTMRRRRARAARGLCVACGYDLRGAEHHRCPECGSEVRVPVTAVQFFAMKRRLMQFLFGLGLLLTLGAATLWLRGWWTSDVFAGDRWGQESRGGAEFLSFHANRHAFWLHWSRQHPTPDGDRAAEPMSAWEFVHEEGDPVGYTFLHDGRVRSEWEAAPQSPWGRLGFALDYSFGERYGRDQTISGADVTLPAWLVVLACAGLTYATGLRLWRARRGAAREAIGLCAACGYDLRGAAHERCPECGGIVEVRHAQAG